MDIKKILDRFYGDYDFKERMRHDPIEFPHRYVLPADIETAGFISSCFAYGKVELFRAVLQKIFSIMGGSPSAFLAGFDLKKDAPRFAGIKYRFNENEDILCLFLMVHEVLKKNGNFIMFSEGHREIRRFP